MTEQKAHIVLMLMATVVAYIRHTEATLKTSKLRKNIRMSINRLEHRQPEYYSKTEKEANDALERVKNRINDREYEVTLSALLIALYKFIERTEYAEIWFTRRMFDDAISSLENSPKNKPMCDEPKVEHDSNKLADMLAEEIGIEYKSPLSSIKMKLNNELALENKEWKDGKITA